MTKLNKRLEVPGILVRRNGEIFAALDPSEVEEERARPELFFHTAYWRLLLRRSESWQDGGYATSQTESGRGFLMRRVMTTIGAFDGKAVDEFSFRMSLDPLPLLSGRTSTQTIDRDDPIVARLRGICHDVASNVTSAQQSLQVMDAFSSGAEYVIEMKDGFDYSDYYIPVMPGQDPQELIARETSGGMQRFMGMLSRERAEQIWPQLSPTRTVPASDEVGARGEEVPKRSTVKDLGIALGFVVVGVAVGIGGVFVADADDAPGAALIALFLMVGALGLAVWTARRTK